MRLKPSDKEKLIQKAKEKHLSISTYLGLNENLEFDHIIPFAKGVANTYWNIQLLCEHFNRSKSDNIG